MKRIALFLPYVVLGAVVCVVVIANLPVGGSANAEVQSRVSDTCPQCDMTVGADAPPSAIKGGRELRFCSASAVSKKVVQLLLK